MYYDDMEYRNSTVNRLFLNSKIRPFPSVTVENHVKLEQNVHQEGIQYDSTYQPRNTINTLAMTNKIVYTKQLGNWTLSPGLKLHFYKKDFFDVSRPGNYFTTRIPLILVHYKMTPKTNISAGLQGLPYFELYFKDFVRTDNSPGVQSWGYGEAEG